MKTEKEILNINPQPFYEISLNLSTIKSLLIFIDLGLNKEFIIEDGDLSNITTLLKQITDNTIKNFEKIQTELNI